MNDTRDIGEGLAGWSAPPRPGPGQLSGAWVELARLSAEAHAADLFRALSAGPDTLWSYMAHGPFASASSYHRWVREVAAGADPLYYAIRNLETGHWEGVASYLRITPDMGTIEVGSITYAPALQRTRAATEAMYLMMQWAFDAGYRRYEWKCDARNLASRRAAQRLGFSYEGSFRQHMVIKGRNRDTAWFAVTDGDWPALKEAYLAWLAPSNFGVDGRQRERLGDLTRLVRVADDPGLRR